MGLFTTQTRRTYHRTQPKGGWSTTSKASTRAKRWARRKAKSWWRTTKRRIRNRWRKYQRTRPRAVHNRQIARRAQQFQRHHSEVHARTVQPTPTAPSYELDTNGNLTPTSGTQVAATGRPPPPDGALATCRRCANEVEYNAARERWEHTGHGDWECFQPHRN